MHFELKDNEGLKELISFAELNQNLSKRVQMLRRLTPEKEQKQDLILL